MRDGLASHLPEDVEAERSFLATCCAPGAAALAAECCLGLSPEVFIHPAHRSVFEALVKLLEEGEDVHALSLKIALEGAGRLGRVGGFQGLVEILSAEDVGRPQGLARHLAAKARLRRLVAIGGELVRRASLETESPEAITDQAAQALSSLVQTRDRQNLRSTQSFSDEWLARQMAILQGETPLGLSVGLPRFDRLTQGFKAGDLVVLAARPGIGKTALALNWTRHVAGKGYSAAYFTLEMSRNEVFSRLVGTETALDLKKLHERGYDPGLFQRLAEAKEALSDLPLFIGDQANLTAREIRAQADQLIARQGKLDFLVVDHLHLLGSTGASSARNENLRIGEITRTLKILAKDLGIPVVLLSQMNREVEHRQNGRPQLSDLKESGSIEADADLVLFLYRKMTPQGLDEPEDPGAELIIAKHRNGPLGVVPLVYDGPIFRFREAERQTDPIRVTRPV